MSVIMVKKRLLNGEPCKKCAQAEEVLRRRGLWQRIDRVVIADEADAQSEGMRMARELKMETAPFFVVSAYLDRLCEHLFRHHGVNIGTFHGAFRRKVGLAVLFVSFAAMILLAGDIASYTGDRLIREATMDVSASVVGAATIYYWISRALTRPIDRLDIGMRRVADDDLATRLPVTSDDEIGRAIQAFNDEHNKFVTGEVTMKLFKGSFRAVGRTSPFGVYNKLLSTYGREDRFDHRAAEGFINLLGLQLQEYSRLHGGGA